MSSPQTFVTVLTKDEQNVFSLSYRGFSDRWDMVYMMGWYVLVKAALKFGVGKIVDAELLAKQISIALLGLFCILFVMPLFVRRARQMGAAWYGVLVIALHALPVLGTVWLAATGSYRGDPVALVVFVGVLVAVLATLPLCLYGGTFSGKKNALMRAAMAGDIHRVRDLAEEVPYAVAVKSDRSLTARDYALRLRHTEIADFLEKVEREHEHNC